MRSAQQVAKRAIVMTTLAFRASLEVTNHPRSETVSGSLFAWLQGQQIADELDPIERQILETPYRMLHGSQLTDASVAGEGACLLAWAIGLCDPPPKREPADAQELVSRLRILRENVKELVDESLMPEDELRACFLDILLTLSIMRQRRLTDLTGQAILQKAVEKQLAELGLSPTQDSLVRCNEFVTSLTADERRDAAGFYFVRSMAASWLLDNRNDYFHS